MIYALILVVISIALKIVESVDQTFLLVILDKILVSMFISCVVSILLTCSIRIWVRFINNFYKDESYLTHTLPVTKNELFNSKVLAGICSLLLSVLVIVICLAFVYLNKSTIEELKMMWDSLVATYNSVFAVLFVIGLVVLIILEIIYIMMAGILGITIGHRSNNFKMVKSIAVGLISYGLLSAMSLGVIGIVSKIIDYDIIGNGFPSMNYLIGVGSAGLAVYLIYNIVYYLIAKKVFNKGVNVD